ncbi:MAG TPA: UDP-N-acetylmuramoyl-L-alanine--D-glutamate ligase [Bacillota bacterium]|nr:MAG: UDP-N-acetylmuramoylalanine--D-glutamate ligase [Firmicutes bacterium ADurb.Bin153]HNV34933.1 UDP-N-acetylmuramoyl-L-alanine--D-glutamate ligase [Bacillota bacterium]
MSSRRQNEILCAYDGARIAVTGLARTSVPLVRVLSRAGARITVFDRKSHDELKEQTDKLAGTVYELRAGSEAFEGIDSFDYVFPSPGINPNRPDFLAARAAGVKFGYEIELTMQLAECPVIGITGSSGKTTTTTLTGLILEEACRRRGKGNVLVGGNIGQPLVEEVLDTCADDFVVLEMSSFQLKFLRTSPDVAAVLNITPNHLDVHPNMEDYISSKCNILSYQKGTGIAVLGADDTNAASLRSVVKGDLAWFSAGKPVDKGALLRGDDLCLRSPGRADEAVMSRKDIKIPGMHNVKNVLAAMAITSACGAGASDMLSAVRKFEGVEHRLETAGEAAGILYINDSIATSPARTMAALDAMEMPIVLIAGGYDKHLPFDPMAELAIGKVKHLVTLGVTAPKIEEAFKAAAARKNAAPPATERASTFDEAVRMADAAAVRGDVVLMSPACASYDMFNNFEERGRRFKELVKDIISSRR